MYQESSHISLKCQETLHLKISSAYVVCCIFLQTFQTYILHIGKQCGLFVLRFYGPVNPMGSCRAWSVYLTTRLLGRLCPLSG